MTGLTEDMAAVLEPLRKMAERLSAGERALVDKTCDEVIGMCQDEERAAEVTTQLLMEADAREEDA